MAHDRVEFVKDKLDEIYGSRGAHLEYMGDNQWFLLFTHEDGTQTALWFKSRDLRKPSFEIRTTIDLKACKEGR
jgi:hypothetical protein